MNYKVLLIEDNHDNSMLFCYILQRAGFTVTAAFNAEEAAAALKSFHPDIILSDISLPGMNGNEFLKIIRADERLKNTCAIAVSAYAREEDKKRTLESGYNSFIEKPINIETFAKEVTDIYEQEKNQQGVK